MRRGAGQYSNFHRSRASCALALVLWLALGAGAGAQTLDDAPLVIRGTSGGLSSNPPPAAAATGPASVINYAKPKKRTPLLVLCGAAAGAALWLPLRECRRAGLDAMGQLLVGVLAAGLLAPGWLARPHLLAQPMLALWTLLLLRAAGPRRSPPCC